MKRYLILILIFLSLNIHSKAQITLTVKSKINTVCNGNPCNYSGPSVLINEVMLSPLVGNGSTFDIGVGDDGEWSELYNPNLCKPVDVSCFYLGNNASDPGNYGGGFRIPSNTIIPARGFLIIRGTKAPAVPDSLLVQNGGRTIEIVATDSLYDLGEICWSNGGRRLWFPDAGGWFAFYDNNGVPQDAISWNSMTNDCMSCIPCIASYSGCSNIDSLASYDLIPINRKTYITTENPAGTDPTYITSENPSGNNLGRSWCRIPDGGPWSSFSHTPTEGTCDTTCNPAPVITCNGKAWVTTSGGVSPYSYQWDDPQATVSDTVKGLCAGIYHVTVTDASEDTATMSVEIKGAVIETSVSVTDIKCYGGKDGSAIATASNGTSPYTYSWSNGDTLPTINNLSVGNYSVTITDNIGCSGTSTTTVTQPPQLNVAATKVDSVRCYEESNGSITVEPSGGTSPYTYRWNTTPAQFAPIAENLTAGTYTVTVTDNNGCTDTLTTTVTQPPQLKVAINKYKNKLCFDDTMKVVAIPGNGTQPYTYKWYPGNYTTQSIILTNTKNTDTLSVQNLVVTVSDSLNCKDSTAFSVTYLPEIKVQAKADSVCPVACNGLIVLKVKDSNGNTDANGKLCTYLWSNLQTTKDDTLLCLGTYEVTITDHNNCQRILDSLTITLLLPDSSHNVSPLAGYSPLNVNFVYKGKSKNITWIFGDIKGDSSKLHNITHQYLYNLNNSLNGVTTYKAEIVIKNKCTDTIKFTIDVKVSGQLDSVSNVITSINQFGAKGNGLKSFNIKIYDRWGVEVYEKTNYVPESILSQSGDDEIYYLWDGNNKNGNRVSEGTYFYILNATTVEDKTLPYRKGSITVLK